MSKPGDMLSTYKYIIDSDMGELSQHFKPDCISPNNAVPPVDTAPIYPYGIPPSRTLDYSKGYPTYEGSDVHYVTFELAQLIASEDIAARYTRSRMKGPQYAHYREDAVQEALFSLMDSFKDRPPELRNDTIYTLFYTILGRRVADIYRKVDRRKEELAGELPEGIERVQAVEDTVLAGLGQTHAALVLQVLSANLPRTQKEQLAHYIAHPGLSSREDGDMLGKTEGSVRVIKGRMLGNMRKKYEQLKEAGVADTDMVTQSLVRMGRDLRRRKQAEQLSTSSVQNRLHEEIRDQRLNRQREVELIVPPYLGAWSVGATDLKAYLGLVQTDAKAAIVYPHKAQLGEFEAYIRPQLGHHSDATTIYTPDSLRSALLDRFSYVIAPPDIEPALLLKLYRHANFVLHLVNHDTEPKDVPRLEAPRFSNTVHAVEWSKADSIRYIREVYFALGRSPTENDLKALSEKDQGPSIYRSSKDFKSLASLVMEALAPLRA